MHQDPPLISAEPADAPSPTEMLRVFRNLRRVFKPSRPVGDLKPSEFMLLFRIRRSDAPQGVKVTELSCQMRVSSPTVTQLVNALEAKGLLERTKDDTDGRVVRIKLTPEGERITKQVENAFLTGLQGLIEHLGSSRSRLLIELLDDVFLYFESCAPAFPVPSDAGASHSPKEGD